MTPVHNIIKRIQNVLALFGCTLGTKEFDVEGVEYYHILGSDGNCVDVHVYAKNFVFEHVLGRSEEALDNLMIALQFKFTKWMQKGVNLHIDVFGVRSEVYEEYQP